MQTSAAAVALEGVTKTFSGMKAVDHLDLAIPRGALYGFIGPNGAGKTTTIRIIMSILFADTGGVSVLGHASALEAKNRIGYLPEERGVYRKMRVGAFLSYMARLKDVADRDVAARVARGLERVGLGGTDRKRCEELSKGMLQKVQFLAAIIHEPDLLILDEPFSGLDPVSARQLRDFILEEHRRGATILFSTHVMPHAEEICEHVVMIHRGRKVLDEPLAAIRRQFDPRSIHFEPFDPAADLEPLRRYLEVERIERASGGYEIVLSAGSDPAAAVQRIAAAIAPARIELSRPRLEDIFLRLVGSAASGALARDELRGEVA